MSKKQKPQDKVPHQELKDQSGVKKFIEWNKKRKAKKKEPETLGESLLSWLKTIVGAIIVVMIINGLAIASFVVPTGSMEDTVMPGDFLFVNKFVYGPSTPQVIPFVNIPLPFVRFPGIKDPEKGDVIVFIYPGDRDEVEDQDFQYYLKRCIAVGGDTIEIKNNVVYINGKKQPMPELAKTDPSAPRAYDKWQTFPPGKGFTRDNYGPILVPQEGDTLHLSKKNWKHWEYFIRKEGHEITTDNINILIDGKPQDHYIIERDYVFGMGDNRDHSADSGYWGVIPEENVVGTPIMVYWSWSPKVPITDFFEKISTIRWSRIGTLID